MSLYTIQRFLRKYYQVGAIGLGTILLVISIMYQIFYLNKPSDARATQAEMVLRNNHGQMASLCWQWLDTDDDTLFLDRLWSLGVDDYWNEQKLSLFLFSGDTMVYWGYNPYNGTIDDLLLSEQSGTIDTLSGYQVLTFRFKSHNKSATVVMQLKDMVNNKLNENVFLNSNIRISPSVAPITATTGSQLQEVVVDQTRFYIEPRIEYQAPKIMSFISWLGVLLLVLALKNYFYFRTTRHNVFWVMAAFLVTIVGLRVLFAVSPIPYQQGRLFSHLLDNGQPLMGSLGDLLLSFTMALIYLLYIFKAKSKILWRYRRCRRWSKFLMLILFLMFINAVVLFFHYTLVTIIYDTGIGTELYDLFSVSFSSLLFYLVGGVVITFRILANKLTATFFADFSFTMRLMISIVILAMMIVPADAMIRNTGYLLLIFHTLFVLSAQVSRSKNGDYGMFLTSVLVFALYTTFFTSVESNSAYKTMAQDYMHTVCAAMPEENVVHISKFTYAIIHDGAVTTTAGSNVNLQPIFPVLTAGIDTMIQAEDFQHLVHHLHSGYVVVVSYPETSAVDYMALFSYIYILMFVICSVILTLIGYRLGLGNGWSRMAMKIRLALVGIVLLALISLAVVIVNRSMANLNDQKRLSVNNNIQNMQGSFLKFMDENPTSPNPLLQWPKRLGNNLGRFVCTYDTTGNMVAHTSREVPVSRISNTAYRNLKWFNAPYFIYPVQANGMQYLSVYSPLYYNGILYGYLNIINMDPLQEEAKRSTITSTLNIFVIILLLILTFSFLIYQQITKPLSRLKLGLQNINQLTKIPVRSGGMSPYDEVETLIIQYNKMIDYIEDSYKQLAATEREDAWREMAKQVAHEIKNPLTPMRLKIQMLERAIAIQDPQVEEKTLATLKTLLTQIDLLSHIATEFSDFAKLNEGTPTLCDLRVILLEVYQLFESNKDIDLTLNISIDTPIYIMADQKLLSRVFINLCQNAIQATASQQHAMISIGIHLPDSRHVRVDIQDNGEGIPECIQEHIFEPNFTTKSSGSGLGLAISAQVIRNMNGHITFVSDTDHGTTFSVTMPLKS